MGTSSRWRPLPEMAPQSATRNVPFSEGPRKCRYSGCESRQTTPNCLSTHESRCPHRHGVAKKPAGIKKKKAKAAPAAAPKKTVARKTTGKASKPAPAPAPPAPAPPPAVAPSPATEAAATTLDKVADAPSDAPGEASEGRRLRSSGGGGGSEAPADQNVSPAAGE